MTYHLSLEYMQRDLDKCYFTCVSTWIVWSRTVVTPCGSYLTVEIFAEAHSPSIRKHQHVFQQTFYCLFQLGPDTVYRGPNFFLNLLIAASIIS